MKTGQMCPGSSWPIPRIVKKPRPIRELTYRELRELAYLGAPVLQDEAIFPVRELSIPLHIRNTNAPEDPGTIAMSSRGYIRHERCRHRGENRVSV